MNKSAAQVKLLGPRVNLFAYKSCVIASHSAKFGIQLMNRFREKTNNQIYSKKELVRFMLILKLKFSLFENRMEYFVQRKSSEQKYTNSTNANDILIMAQIIAQGIIADMPSIQYLDFKC